jgi:hypothetical protein
MCIVEANKPADGSTVVVDAGELSRLKATGMYHGDTQATAVGIRTGSPSEKRLLATRLHDFCPSVCLILRIEHRGLQWVDFHEA